MPHTALTPPLEKVSGKHWPQEAPLVAPNPGRHTADKSEERSSSNSNLLFFRMQAGMLMKSSSSSENVERGVDTEQQAQQRHQH